MKTKKGHSKVCLQAHQGVGKNEGFTCTDNCLDKPQHTPTPWIIAGNKNNRYILSHDETQHSIAHKLFDSDAEYIVRAVNAHDALVSALSDCLDAMIHGDTIDDVTFEKYKVLVNKAQGR